MNNTAHSGRISQLSAKDSIAAMRSALRAVFPGIKFSVTMSRGTAYGNASVAWTDGPTTAEVEVVTDRFETVGFDGMTDSTTYSPKVIEYRGQEWDSGVRMVLENRRISPERMAEMGAFLRRSYPNAAEGSILGAARMLAHCTHIGWSPKLCDIAIADAHHHLS